MTDYYSYTPAESRERSRLFRKGFKQAFNDQLDTRVTRRIHEIDAKAAERGARELDSLRRKQDADRQAVADAKTAVRTAVRTDKAAAREVLRAAEKQLRRTERVVDKAERS